MLDADDVVVTHRPQRADDLLPLCHVHTVADRTEDPAAVQLVAVMLRIEHAVEGGVVLIDLRILRVEVEDRVAELANDRHRVHSLPDEVARIEVRADVFAGRFADAQHRLGVVNAEAGMKLERDLYAVLLRELLFLLPVRNKLLVPLVIEDVEELRRPGGGDPVGVRSGRAVAGTAGEGIDDRNAEPFREQYGAGNDGVVIAGDLFIRMDGVAVRGERGDDKSARLELAAERLRGAGIGNEQFRIAVVVAGEAPDAELGGLDAVSGEEIERFGEVFVVEYGCEYAEFHRFCLLYIFTADEVGAAFAEGELITRPKGDYNPKLTPTASS